jgi:hypothetical protein
MVNTLHVASRYNLSGLRCVSACSCVLCAMDDWSLHQVSAFEFAQAFLQYPRTLSLETVHTFGTSSIPAVIAFLHGRVALPCSLDLPTQTDSRPVRTESEYVEEPPIARISRSRPLYGRSLISTAADVPIRTKRKSASVVPTPKSAASSKRRKQFDNVLSDAVLRKSSLDCPTPVSRLSPNDQCRTRSLIPSSLLPTESCPAESISVLQEIASTTVSLSDHNLASESVTSIGGEIRNITSTEESVVNSVQTFSAPPVQCIRYSSEELRAVKSTVPRSLLQFDDIPDDICALFSPSYRIKMHASGLHRSRDKQGMRGQGSQAPVTSGTQTAHPARHQQKQRNPKQHAPSLRKPTLPLDNQQGLPVQIFEAQQQKQQQQQQRQQPQQPQHQQLQEHLQQSDRQNNATAGFDDTAFALLLQRATGM